MQTDRPDGPTTPCCFRQAFQTIRCHFSLFWTSLDSVISALNVNYGTADEYCSSLLKCIAHTLCRRALNAAEQTDAQTSSHTLWAHICRVAKTPWVILHFAPSLALSLIHSPSLSFFLLSLFLCAHLCLGLANGFRRILSLSLPLSVVRWLRAKWQWIGLAPCLPLSWSLIHREKPFPDGAGRRDSLLRECSVGTGAATISIKQHHNRKEKVCEITIKTIVYFWVVPPIRCKCNLITIFLDRMLKLGEIKDHVFNVIKKSLPISRS